jgi:hypothetical protein
MRTSIVSWAVMGMLFLAACSSSNKQASETAEPTPEQVKAMQREADKIIDQQMTKLQKKEASTWPCSLFSQSEIEALAGNPLDKGSYAFNNVSDNDHEYKSESCGWSASGGGSNEISLWVSLPKHFKSGRVECSPGSTDKKISGIGDQAWWEYQKYWGAGTLRVCSEKAMLEVKATMKGAEEAAVRKTAQAVAEKVLASQ